MFSEKRGENPKKYFRVFSCVIYKIISKYVCTDYLGYEKTKLSDLRLGVSGRYKNIDKNYDNVLGFGIPDLLLNLLYFRDSQRTTILLS